jgi:catechol 2,3-dioxygenase-like lactoylglutathione lyase family enzyme
MFSITQTNVTITVNDMSKSISFYTDVLGFKLLQRYGDHYAQVSAPGIIIGLHPSNGKANTSENISIGFTVNDLSAAKKQLDELAIPNYERAEAGGSFVHFKDPDGTPLYFIDSKR